MVLSLLSILRRRGHAKKLTSRPSPRRFTSLPPGRLLAHLADLTEPLSPSAARDLTLHLSSPANLELLIVDALDHPAHARPLFLLLTYTDAPRRIVANSQSLLSLLTKPFAHSDLPPPLAAHICTLFAKLLADYPVPVATFLHRSRFAEQLVRHIALQPAADLIPRLAGTRVFAPLQPAPIVPAHKRALVLLLSARVQDSLADTFVRAACELRTAQGARRARLNVVLENAAGCMAELSARALLLPRKLEDADERLDSKYALSLGVVSSAVCNDTKDHLVLVKNVAALRKVLAVALDERETTEALLAGVECATAVLRAVREARDSPLEGVREALRGVELGEVGKVVAGSRKGLVRVLEEEGVGLGRRRLAVLDLLREAVGTLPGKWIGELVTTDGDEVWCKLMEAAERYERNDVLQTRVAQIMEGVFMRGQEVGGGMMERTNVVGFLADRVGDARMDGAVKAVLGFAGNKMMVGDEVKRLRKGWERKRREMMKLRMTAVKGEEEREWGGEMIANEDCGRELYLYGVLEEVSRRDHRIPPSDNNVH